MRSTPFVGQCVSITRNSGRHGVKVGSRMVLAHVDESDQTVRGYVEGSKRVADWLPWGDIEPVRFGWDYVCGHLPPDVVTLLNACDRIRSLALNDRVQLAILATLPDLRQRITDAVREVEADDVGF